MIERLGHLRVRAAAIASRWQAYRPALMAAALLAALLLFVWAPDALRVLNRYALSVAMVIFAAALWQRGWRALAVLPFALGVIWLACHFQIVTWSRSLGADSFSEAQFFDHNEAWFYLSTLVQSVTGGWKVASVVRSVAILSVLFVATVAVLRSGGLSRRSRQLVSLLAIAGVVLPLYGMASTALTSFERNERRFAETRQNFTNPAPQVALSRAGLNLVVYIGESTSSMHLGLYSYPRATTPRLSARDKKGELIVVDNVFATHTHTTPSLFEALSFEIETENDYIPVTSRKRLSVVDVLAANGVATQLYSNQGQAGTWNLASAILFAKARKSYSNDTVLSINDDSSLDKPFDADFLLPRLTTATTTMAPERSSVVFLHGYAGHGPYDRYVPEAQRGRVDDFYKGMSPQAILGTSGSGELVETVEHYDTAMRYVDHSVDGAIDVVAASAHPTVFIYFSDHGDSPFTGAGHDSSRFAHEMSRVPFLIYFNAAARETYPALHTRYRDLHRKAEISTLAQFGWTVIDLLGGALPTAAKCATIVGVRCHDVEPILVRQTNGGLTYVSLDGEAAETDLVAAPSDTYFPGGDTATDNLAAARAAPVPGATICYHRSNSIAKALRGTLVSDCLEVDVTFDEERRPAVLHPPNADVGLTLPTIASIAETSGRSLWIDVKNLDVPGHCEALLKLTEPMRHKKTLVEFPPTTQCTSEALKSCARKLRERGYATSYYVPTKAARKCSETLDGKGGPGESDACKALESTLRTASQSGCFSDFSFDYRMMPAMSAVPSGKDLRWNTWEITARQLAGVDTGLFNFIILKNSDPNTR